MCMQRIMIWLCLTTICFACGDDTLRDPTSLVRDSAGVKVVDVLLPQWLPGEEWHVDREPMVVIGAGDADRGPLFRVRGAVRLNDGTIVVANVGSSELIYYDSSGQWLRNSGRRGQGPGEFGGGTGPWSLWKRQADTVAAWDFSNLRLSFFNAEGHFVRSVLLHPKAETPTRLAGVLDEGQIVTYHVPFSQGDRPDGTEFRDSVLYQLFASDGTWLENIALLPGVERWSFEWMGRWRQGVRPFYRAPNTAAGKSSFYYTSGDRFEILRFNAAGRLEAVVRVRAEPRRVTDKDISDFIDDRMADAPDASDGVRAWRRILDNAPFPERFPAFEQLVVDAIGNSWARLYDTPSDSVATWMVFGPNDTLFGSVVTPRRFTVYEIGMEYVLGVWRDEADAEYVRMYRLTKSHGGR